MVMTPPSHGGGHAFESHRAHLQHKITFIFIFYYINQYHIGTHIVSYTNWQNPFVYVAKRCRKGKGNGEIKR